MKNKTIPATTLLLAGTLLLACQATSVSAVESDDIIIEGEIYSIEEPYYELDSEPQGEGQEIDENGGAFASKYNQSQENAPPLLFKEGERELFEVLPE